MSEYLDSLGNAIRRKKKEAEQKVYTNGNNGNKGDSVEEDIKDNIEAYDRILD